MNLKLFVHNELEVIINLNNGEAFTSIAGYVRMSGKAYSTIQERVAKYNIAYRKKEIKSAKVRSGSGVQVCRLIPGELPTLT